MGRSPSAGTPASPRDTPGARHTLLTRIWQSIVLRGPAVPRTDRDRAFVTVQGARLPAAELAGEPESNARADGAGTTPPRRRFVVRLSALQRTAFDVSQVAVA